MCTIDSKSIVSKQQLQQNQPKPPPPYSGKLFTQISVELSDESRSNSPVLSHIRARSKSSGHAERHSVDTSILTRSNRTSSQSSVSVQSVIVVAERNSTIKQQSNEEVDNVVYSQTTPSKEVTERQTVLSSQQETVERQHSNSSTATSKEDTYQRTSKTVGMSVSDDDDEYVQMSSAVRLSLASSQAVSSPLLTEDNMYVTMTSPAGIVRKHEEASPPPGFNERTYYNVCNYNKNKNSSMPDLLNSNPSQETPNTISIYEEIDFSRPVPPPRRKKLLKLQAMSAEASGNSSGQIRHHTLSSATTNSNPTNNIFSVRSYSLRKERTTTVSPRRKERPHGMVFSELDEITLQETLTQ